MNLPTSSSKELKYGGIADRSPPSLKSGDHTMATSNSFPPSQ